MLAWSSAAVLKRGPPNVHEIPFPSAPGSMAISGDPGFRTADLVDFDQEIWNAGQPVSVVLSKQVLTKLAIRINVEEGTKYATLSSLEGGQDRYVTT